MEIENHRFDHDVTLVNLGDVHRGDNACDVEAFRRQIKRIKEDDSVFWVSTGDLLNCGTKDSKSGPYGSMVIDDELEALRRDLDPIIDKCLGIVESNHHKRVARSVGMNLDKLISREFGVRYLGNVGALKITCKKNSYFIAMHHGVGGGRTMGAKVNGVGRLEEVLPGFDLYLEGHTHTHVAYPDVVNYLDRKRNKITEMVAWFSVTGHYLKFFDSYATEMKLRPKPIGSAAHHLRAGDQTKKIRVEFWEA